MNQLPPPSETQVINDHVSLLRFDLYTVVGPFSSTVPTTCMGKYQTSDGTVYMFGNKADALKWAKSL
jgi:hypothetical protein